MNLFVLSVVDDCHISPATLVGVFTNVDELRTYLEDCEPNRKLFTDERYMIQVCKTNEPGEFVCEFLFEDYPDTIREAMLNLYIYEKE